MVGIKFEVKAGYNNLLNKIFYLIDVTNYEWEIITDDIVDPESSSKYSGIFNADTVDGQRFLSKISKESYQLIFADFKAFPVGSEHIEIKTYEDYINSSCQMIFLCVDSGYIDFYCKDKSIIEKVHKNCLDNSFENIKFISADEASNNEMIAW